MATSQISLLSFSEMADTVNRTYTNWQKLVPGLATVKGLYKTESIARGVGDRKIYQETDGGTFAKRKREGAEATKTTVTNGYNKTMYAYRYAAEIDITAEARMFGKNQEIKQKMTDLSQFIPQRQLIDLTHRFTFMGNLEYVNMDGDTVDVSMGDGLALQSASHELTEDTTGYSNVITGNVSFSATGLDIARNQARTQTLSNFGEKRVMNFTTIVTGEDATTCREVYELFDSMGAPGGGHSGIANIDKGAFRHVKLAYMDTDANGANDSTKAKYWFLIAVGQWEAHFGEWEAGHLKMPSAGNNGEDVHTDDWTYGTRGTWGIAIVSGKGCLCSKGDNS